MGYIFCLDASAARRVSISPSGHVAGQAPTELRPHLQKAVRAPIDLCLLSTMAAAA